MHQHMLPILVSLLSAAISVAGDVETCSGIVPMKYRNENVSITDFGGIGDGETVNTAAFAAAINRIESLRREGGSLLYIPAGVYLTGRFNLTSSMTLYLASGAVIKATQVYRVCFTLGYTMFNFVARFLTILAPAESPNTDGIDPDSSSNVCIEDSYISTGDDLVAVKSGWDEYSIAYGHPSSNITIRRVNGSSPYAGIAVGSETSGGVENVLAEHINLFNMGIGIHIKTKVGRGGFIRNITLSYIHIENARIGIKMSGDVGDHPDESFDPNAIPIVDGISMKNIYGQRIRQSGFIKGIKNAPFINICLSDVNFNGSVKTKTAAWDCSNVQGSSSKVSPLPCSQLISPYSTT